MTKEDEDFVEKRGQLKKQLPASGSTRAIKRFVAGKTSTNSCEFTLYSIELGFLLGNIVAVRFLNALESTIFLAVFLDKSAGYQVLQFFISAETKHFFSTADCIALFQPLIDILEKLVEAEKLRI